MNEKQLKEVNNGNNLRIREEDVSAENEDGGKTIIEWAIIGLALGFIVVAVGFFIWNKYYQKDKEVSSLKSQIENLQKTGENTTEKENISSETASASEEAIADAYPGWKTYTNSEVGYTLRYPADWNLKETDGVSEVTEANIKYITIDTPDKKYFLHFGLKGKNDNFYISDRTGVGAGEIKKIGVITVLGTDTKVEQLFYEGKIHEIFFGAVSSNTTADGKYIFGANFGSRGDTYSGPGIDPNLSYIKTTEKILESVALVDKTSTGSDCSPSFTAEDNLNMKNWKTFKNSKYGFSLMYPNDWQIKNSSSNNLVLGDKGEAMTFQIKSDMAAFGLENYKLGSKRTVKLACKNVTVTTYIADPEVDPSFSGNERLVITSFEKDGTAHTIFFSYKDIGASISSDIVEQFDLILKSIKYVQ